MAAQLPHVVNASGHEDLHLPLGSAPRAQPRPPLPPPDAALPAGEGAERGGREAAAMAPPEGHGREWRP